tara:strand:+ start:393 stop:866 length:474 start_codon:yes stop_codon:yes gene_type:complete
MANKMFTIKVSGLKELEEALNALDHDLHKKVLKAAGKAAMAPVATSVRNNVPKDTGGLYSTIRLDATTDVRRLKKAGRKASMIASVSAGRRSKKSGATGHQALNVEYGNSRTKARPFMRPAIQGRERSTILQFRKHLRIGVNKSAKTQARRTSRLLK